MLHGMDLGRFLHTPLGQGLIVFQENPKPVSPPKSQSYSGIPGTSVWNRLESSPPRAPSKKCAAKEGVGSAGAEVLHHNDLSAWIPRDSTALHLLRVFLSFIVPRESFGVKLWFLEISVGKKNRGVKLVWISPPVQRIPSEQTPVSQLVPWCLGNLGHDWKR